MHEPRRAGSGPASGASTLVSFQPVQRRCWAGCVLVRVSKKLTIRYLLPAANGCTNVGGNKHETLGPLNPGGFSLPGQFGRRHIIKQMVATLAAMATSWPMVMVQRNTATWCIVRAPSEPEPVR